MLEIRNLYSKYPGGINNIIKNFTYKFEENETYVLLGPNGSGKTTLFNAIGGFINITNGNIFLDNKNITKSLPFSISRLGISRTFQDLRLFNSLTVYENILVSIPDTSLSSIHCSLLKPCSHRMHKDLITKTMNDFEITSIASQKASSISYGQQKLLTLAMAIVGNPKVLLLDEPIAGIQPLYIEKIKNILRKINKTIILIEHNTNFIKEITDNVVFIHQGEVIKTGAYDDLKEDKNIRELYL